MSDRLEKIKEAAAWAMYDIGPQNQVWTIEVKGAGLNIRYHYVSRFVYWHQIKEDTANNTIIMKMKQLKAAYEAGPDKDDKGTE